MKCDIVDEANEQGRKVISHSLYVVPPSTLYIKQDEDSQSSMFTLWVYEYLIQYFEG